MTKFNTKPTTMKPTMLPMLERLIFGQLLAAMPADGQQQVHGQALVDHVRELEPHLQDRDQEPEVEEQQQRLEQVVGEVMPKLIQHRFLLLVWQ